MATSQSPDSQLIAGGCGCGKPQSPILSPRAKSSSTLDTVTAVCSPTGFDCPANRQACAKATQGSQAIIGQEFNMFADFSNNAPADCSTCEYRQLIRGYWRYRHTPTAPWMYLTVYGYGPAPIPNLSYTPIEDGCNGGIHRYGHRHDNNFCDDNYFDDNGNVDRLNGCHYEGYDVPFIIVDLGEEYEMYLEFTGQIVDTGTGDPVATRSWTVACSGIA